MTTQRRLPPLLRNKFVAGLVVLIPIIITAKALWWLFQYVDGLARPLAVALFGRTLPGSGFVLTVGIILLTGFLFSYGPPRRLLEWIEQILTIVPLVGAIYGTTKKVLAGFGNSKSQEAFKRFVLVRLPGRTTPGFLTGSFELKSAEGAVEPFATVYIPTNHLWFGDVVVVAVEDVIDTNLSVEDGVSLILSMGASVPPTLLRK